MITIKSSREIEFMRQTCQLAARTLQFAGQHVRPNISTEEINQIVHTYILENNAYPSPLNYHGFPKSICTSLNEVVCHGIPSPDDILKEGDILNIDVTTKLNGFHGDTNATFIVGNVPSKVRNFVETAYQCLMLGIQEARAGSKLGDIGAAIQEYAEDHGHSVVRDYCGHGIGREFHEDPQVLHYGKRNTGTELKPGMVFTIEPMINMGGYHCKLLKDGWTAVTKDNSLSAQFEHTILIPEGDPEILTAI